MLYSTAHKSIDYTIISTVEPIYIFVVSTIIFIISIITIVFSKLLKKHTFASFIAIFIMLNILVSHHLIDIHHFFTSKDIKFKAKVIQVNKKVLEEKYHNTLHPKSFTIETQYSKLNHEYIFPGNHVFYQYLEIGDTLEIEGAISEYIFEAKKLNFFDEIKNKYYKNSTKHDGLKALIPSNINYQ